MAHMAVWSSVCFCRLPVRLLYCTVLFLIAASVCGLLLSGFAQGGATYYVAPTGSDSNPGTSAAPWRTIQKAANTLNGGDTVIRSEEHTSELQSQSNLVCRLLLEKKKHRRTVARHVILEIDRVIVAPQA